MAVRLCPGWTVFRKEPRMAVRLCPDGQIVAPCDICTSIIRGGIAQGAMDADAMIAS
jgi:hypothetical protein